ncbi:hypothetical protein GCM10011409_39900 [Lentibacillus populi]|uniref:Uncharacterized protein n=1 Tax=Lentibacillus populi TaxID=1827502 RepID=A0A9W5X757_9BACI|nr:MULTISPECIES: hypothetical protein [Bacillaceae]GGB58449.1 hypothetical protein GCM10011409_39900 [Lentibacillus populi]
MERSTITVKEVAAYLGGSYQYGLLSREAERDTVFEAAQSHFVYKGLD